MVRVLKQQERLTISNMFVEAARETHREYMPELSFGSTLDTLYLAVCVAIGDLDGKAFSATKLAAYLECPRTSAIRRLEVLVNLGLIVQRGSRYYLNEQRVNSDSAMKSYEVVKRIVLKAAKQLSEMDTLGRDRGRKLRTLANTETEK